ncbi:5'-3'-deoxyribonucleotidase [Candidatus Woesearchaeota archaeon]|nr:5'-3'-deoxyribonucleotidase [Candidatus Woesearchaeota archaeon]
MRILVDMDDVISDFDKGFELAWKKHCLDKPYIPVENRTTFYIQEFYPEHLQPLVREVFSTPGFYLSLPPILGGLEAMVEMKRLGHDVFICTTPLSDYEHCVLEKYKWIEKNLGKKWTEKLILTKDKTVVTGAYLIDDKPEITGAAIPVWEHILYDKSYNKQIKKKRLTWQEDWKKILGI